MNLITITKQQWNDIPNDYKGRWTEQSLQWQQDLPKEFIGQRTVLSGCISDNKGSSLLTEGIHFKIV